MPWLLRPPPTTGAERRGLKTRHRSRGVIRAGSSALFPLTPSRGSPTRLRRLQRHFARVARESKGEKLPLFCARTDVFATARATRARWSRRRSGRRTQQDRARPDGRTRQADARADFIGAPMKSPPISLRLMAHTRSPRRFVVSSGLHHPELFCCGPPTSPISGHSARLSGCAPQSVRRREPLAPIPASEIPPRSLPASAASAASAFSVRGSTVFAPSPSPAPFKGMRQTG